MNIFVSKANNVFFSCFIALLLVSQALAQNNINHSMLLSTNEVKAKIQDLPQWTTDGKKISRTFEFKDFVAAVDFVNQIVEPAESAGHHPDLEISYNKVTVSLTTHDAGGLTNLDFALAEKISDIAK